MLYQTMDLFKVWDNRKQESPQCSVHISGERRNTGLSQVQVPQAAGELPLSVVQREPALSWSCQWFWRSIPQEDCGEL